MSVRQQFESISQESILRVFAIIYLTEKLRCLLRIAKLEPCLLAAEEKVFLKLLSLTGFSALIVKMIKRSFSYRLA